MTTLHLDKPSNRHPLPAPTPEKTAKRWLVNTWPELFCTESPKPLSIGIRSQLAKIRPAAVSHRGLRRALSRWCSRFDYRQAIARGGPRFGLNGEQGHVTPEQQRRARIASKRQGPQSVKPRMVRVCGNGAKRDTERDTKGLR
jgi:sRNA-binding protein